MRFNRFISTITFISLILSLLFSSGCLNTDGNRANNLIEKANTAIKKYADIEKKEISPLRAIIDRTEANVEGAGRSLDCTQKILHKVELQKNLLKRAKKDIRQIPGLIVNDHLKTYAALTVKALDADLQSLEISIKLYGELKNMYTQIKKEKLEQKEYEKITAIIKDLSDKSQEAADKQQKQHLKKDAYYKKHRLGD